MQIDVDFSEFEQFQRDFEKATQDLQGEVQFSELFTTHFMNKYTEFSSLDDLIIDCGYNVTSQADFEAIPEEEFDAKIAARTSFNSWQDMLGKATEEYFAKKLKF